MSMAPAPPPKPPEEPAGAKPAAGDEKAVVDETNPPAETASAVTPPGSEASAAAETNTPGETTSPATGSEADDSAVADTPADATSPLAAAGTEAPVGASPVPTPYDPEYERPISELPPLTFPNSEDYEFRLAADRRRRTRIRNEAIFGAILVVVGVVVLIAARTAAFLGLAAIAGVAMAAYELTISGLE